MDVCGLGLCLYNRRFVPFILVGLLIQIALHDFIIGPAILRPTEISALAAAHHHLFPCCVFRQMVAGIGGLRCCTHWVLEHGARHLVSSARWFYGQRPVLLLLGLLPIPDALLVRSEFHIALESDCGLTMSVRRELS